jgi:hypothetical protein
MAIQNLKHIRDVPFGGILASSVMVHFHALKKKAIGKNF